MRIRGFFNKQFSKAVFDTQNSFCALVPDYINPRKYFLYINCQYGRSSRLFGSAN